MKKLLAITVALLLMTASFGAFAADIPETVEINFKVGDSVLSINGQPVEVKAPYVVGAGTTLVPLRVITEAFGCTVDWDDATQGITITYPQVTIKMQIGNLNVTVNEHTETLPEAPQLNVDTTMVPLRFISETFGAEVTYDDATQRITVVKTNSPQGTTITGITEKPRIGDSYYGWSIDTPSISMVDRDFDGSYTEFSTDDVLLMIYAYPLDEEVTFDAYFAEIKSDFEGYTLTKADKLTDEFGNRYMHFRGKNKEYMLDVVSYYTKDYSLELFLTMPVNYEGADEFYALIDSFKCSYGDASATHDLSNVEADGTRLYANKDLNYSLSLPAIWDDNNESPANEMFFTNAIPSSDYYSTLSVNIYSKNADMTAESLAKSDHEHNIAFLNTEAAKASDVKEYTVNSAISGYAYTIITKSEHTREERFTDIFFDYGDYIYNITFTLDKDESDNLIKTVLDSLKVEKIDLETVGIMLRNDPETDITFPLTLGDGTFTFGGSWEEIESSNASAALVHRTTGSLLTMNVVNNVDTSGTTSANYLKKVFESAVDKMASNSQVEIAEKTSTFTSNKIKFYTASFLFAEAEGAAYSTICMGIADGDFYTFTFSCEEKYYSKAMQDELRKVVGSLVVK